MQSDRSIRALDLPLREDHELLASRQQVDGQPQGGHRWAPLIHRKTAESLQEPTLQAAHLGGRHHEAAIPTGDPSSRCHRQHQGIPAGPVRGSQHHRAAVGQMLRIQHQSLTELQLQSDVLSDQHRQRGPARVDAHLQCGFTVRQGR